MVHSQIPQVDRTTAERLVELRLLLREAQSRAQDSSRVGRHVALVLLDGVCEATMALAADLLGVHLPAEPKFGVLYERVSERLGDAWMNRRWQPVNALHGARNLAQHRSSLHDPNEIARWAGDVEQFAVSLLGTVLGRDFRDVSTATALATADLRELMLAAEGAVGAGQYEEAVRLVERAFDVARRGWRRQHNTDPDLGPLARISGRNAFTAPQVAADLNRLADYLEVQAFATNLGEYAWLRARRSGANRHVPLTADEVRRAFDFVLTWCLRWEAFALRYDVDEQRARWYDEQRVPHSATPERGPRVARVEVEPVDVRPVPMFRLLLQIVDAPDDEQDWWGVLARQVLDDLWSDIAEQSGWDGVVPSLSDAGVLTFHRVPPEIDQRRVLEFAQRVVDRATSEHEQRQTERSREHRDHARMCDRYRQALAAQAWDDLPEVVGVEVVPAGDQDPLRVRVDVADPREDLADWYEGEPQLPLPDGWDFLPSAILLLPSGNPAADAEQVKGVLATAVARRRSRDAHLADVAAQGRSIASAFNAALPG